MALGYFIARALADILISVAMMSLLTNTQQRRTLCFTPYSIVRLTIETNTLTASVAIISFVVYIAFPHSIYYSLPRVFLLYSKLCSF